MSSEKDKPEAADSGTPEDDAAGTPIDRDGAVDAEIDGDDGTETRDDGREAIKSVVDSYAGSEGAGNWASPAESADEPATIPTEEKVDTSTADAAEVEATPEQPPAELPEDAVETKPAMADAADQSKAAETSATPAEVAEDKSPAETAAADVAEKESPAETAAAAGGAAAAAMAATAPAVEPAVEAPVAEDQKPEDATAKPTKAPPKPGRPPRPGWPGRTVGFLGRSRFVSFLLLLVVSAMLFLPGFFVIPPVDRDEARFAQASRQMVASGDFIDIRLQAEPRHKKPIGIYWMQAAAATVSGEGDRAPIWVYRMPSIAGAVLSVLFLWWAALPLAGRVGAFYAGLLMAGTILIGVEARLAKTDAMLLAMIIAAQGGLIRAFVAEEGQRLRRLTVFIFWTAIGIGVLLKGPLILMVVGLTALALMLMTVSMRWLGRLRPLTGLLWVALIVLPWIIAITIASEGAFFAAAIGKDLLAKVTSVQESHGAPPGTYLAVMWATFWPASVFFALALPWILRHWRRRAVLFCVAWVVPSWIVFELASTKLPHYVLPLYPALAILTGMAIDRGGAHIRSWWRKIVAVLLPIVPVAIAVAVPAGLHEFEQSWSVGGVALTLFAATAGLAGFVALMRDDVRTGLAAALVSALLTYAGVYQFALPAAQSIWVSPRLAQSISRAVPCPDPQIATTSYREPSLVFLTRTDLVMTDDAGAAQFLAEGGCRVALVEAAGEAAFTSAAGNLDLQPRLVGRVAGLNINRGDPVDIGLYTSGAGGR